MCKWKVSLASAGMPLFSSYSACSRHGPVCILSHLSNTELGENRKYHRDLLFRQTQTSIQVLANLTWHSSPLHTHKLRQRRGGLSWELWESFQSSLIYPIISSRLAKRPHYTQRPQVMSGNKFLSFQLWLISAEITANSQLPVPESAWLDVWMSLNPTHLSLWTHVFLVAMAGKGNQKQKGNTKHQEQSGWRSEDCHRVGPCSALVSLQQPITNGCWHSHSFVSHGPLL